MEDEELKMRRITGYYENDGGHVCRFDMKDVTALDVYHNFDHSPYFKRIISVIAFDASGASRVFYDYHDFVPDLYLPLFDELNKRKEV